ECTDGGHSWGPLRAGGRRAGAPRWWRASPPRWRLTVTGPRGLRLAALLTAEKVRGYGPLGRRRRPIRAQPNDKTLQPADGGGGPAGCGHPSIEALGGRRAGVGDRPRARRCSRGAGESTAAAGLGRT